MFNLLEAMIGVETVLKIRLQGRHFPSLLTESTGHSLWNVNEIAKEKVIMIQKDLTDFRSILI